jgi:hypothetical protein
MQLLKLFIVCFSIFSFSGCANYDNMSQSQKQEFWNGIAGGLQGASDALAEQNRRIAAEAAERDAQSRRQVNCTTEFMGSTAYTRCR